LPIEARAAEPTRLAWVRLEGAGSCIDAAELAARVRRRLGTDPFDPAATRSIEGVARRTGGVWRAQIAVRAQPGDVNPPLREFESRADDCEALSNAAVLAVALAVDPAAAFVDAPPPEPPPPAPPRQAWPAPAPTPPITPAPGGVAGRAALTAAAQTGLLPRTSLGVGLAAAAALSQKLELALRAQAFPEVQVSGDPSYASGLAALDLELCVHAVRTIRLDLRACGGPSLGILHAAVLTGNRAQPGERGSLAAALGLDAAFAITGTLAFALGVRAVAPLTRYRFLLEGSDRTLFEQAVVAVTAHAGLELRFDGR
jgi:hypothetical protein